MGPRLREGDVVAEQGGRFCFKPARRAPPPAARACLRIQIAIVARAFDHAPTLPVVASLKMGHDRTGDAWTVLRQAPSTTGTIACARLPQCCFTLVSLARSRPLAP